MAPGPEIAQAGPLDATDLDQVQSLVAAATEADGVPPLSDHARLHLRSGDPEAVNLIARLDGRIIGVAHLDLAGGTAVPPGALAELVVAPAARRRNAGGRLLAAVLDRAGPRPLRVWAHGRHPGAVHLAERLGWRADRTLFRMIRPLGPSAPALPPVTWPTGVRLRTFEVGRDEDAWLRANARAFRELPDQGSWTRSDLEEREAEPWFDPAGFFLAERNDDLLGFHWTKVHPDRPGEAGRPIGEVYVVGIDPAAQGMGLGRSLTVAGLTHLENAGLDTVMLYVDESNTSAVHLYETLGFAVAGVDVSYLSGGDPETAAPGGT